MVYPTPFPGFNLPGNQLLAALPDYVRKLWEPHLEPVNLAIGQVIYEARIQSHMVYFPITAITSLCHDLENGSTTEIAIVGREGLLGFAALFGEGTSPNRVVVGHAGSALRIDARHMKHAFQMVPSVMDLVMLYSQALIAQMTQTAVCNRHHGLEQQLCRWILVRLDRLPGNELLATQELIANMLGVRRESVTEAAGKLQDAGIIEYSRGHITVIDRTRLEERCCECYQVVRNEYARLLPDLIAPQ